MNSCVASSDVLIDLTLTDSQPEEPACPDDPLSTAFSTHEYGSGSPSKRPSWEKSDILGKENADNSSETHHGDVVANGLFAGDFQSAWSDGEEFEEEIGHQV